MSVCIKLHAAMPSAMFLSDADFLSFLKDNWLYPSNPIFINDNDKKTNLITAHNFSDI